MTEKREFKRHQCKIKIDFDYFEGNPDDIDVATASAQRGKGVMLDISRGGAFIVSTSRVGINIPIRLRVEIRKKKLDLEGTVVRTGLMKNNPSEVVQKYAKLKIKEDAYIAIKFNKPIELAEDDLC